MNCCNKNINSTFFRCWRNNKFSYINLRVTITNNKCKKNVYKLFNNF